MQGGRRQSQRRGKNSIIRVQGEDHFDSEIDRSRAISVGIIRWEEILIKEVGCRVGVGNIVKAKIVRSLHADCGKNFCRRQVANGSRIGKVGVGI